MKAFQTYSSAGSPHRDESMEVAMAAVYPEDNSFDDSENDLCKLDISFEEVVVECEESEDEMGDEV